MKPHFKAADKLLNELRVNTTKLIGNRLQTLETYIEVFNNLLNSALRSEAQLEDTQEQLANAIIKAGEIASNNRKLLQRIDIIEQINDIGMDEVLKEFHEKANKILTDKAKQL